MNNLKLAIALLAVSLGGKAYSQDLLSKIPEDSKFVVALNGKGFFKHAKLSQLNDIFKRAGFFKELSEENVNFKTENIEDLGIDFQAKSYLHFNVNDSIQYIGALIPLKSKEQFESILPEDSEIKVVNGLNTIYSDDKRVRVSWDQQTIYILGAAEMNNYFSKDEVKEKYGLLALPEYAWADEAAIAVPDTLDWEGEDYNEIEISIDSTKQIEEEIVTIESTEEFEQEVEGEIVNIPPPAVRRDDDFSSVDSVLERDEYQDDYHVKYAEVTRHNDSIVDIFVNNHVNSFMNEIIDGKFKPYKSKSIVSMKDNELMRMEMGKFDQLLMYYYPTDLIYGTLSRPTIDYGYESINSSVIVDGNRMKLVGDMSFDREMTRYYKEMYSKKMNPKFLKFINDDALAFGSFNVSTEAYLKHMPTIVQRVYGGMDVKVGKIIDLFTTAFDVIVDEKAVAKVFKGDNLFVLNGVSQKEVKYIDYEYDEDYNYQEIEKTKMEKIPNYLWMFSSDDTRIFEKIFAILETEGNLINHEGIYEIKNGKIDEFAPYILIKEGIVFLGNDLEQIQKIKSNEYKVSSGNRYSSIAKKNKFALVFNTKKIPGLVDDLELPVHRSMEAEVKNLAQYGDIYMISNGMKGNKFNYEAGIDFPSGNENALDFIIHTLDNISKSLKD